MPKLTPVREALVAGLMVSLLHAALRLSVAPGAFQDDAIYLALGKALSQGDGWRSIYAIGAPVHLKYPPGLPGLYALAWFTGGSLDTTVAVVRWLHLLVAGACGALVWWMVRVRLGGTAIAAGVAASSLGLIAVVDHWQLAIAEGPLAAVWLGAVGIALAPLTLRRATALGLLLALAILLRSQGWAVALGVLAGLALGRRDRKLIGFVLLVALVPLVTWWGMHAAAMTRGPLSSQPDEMGYLTSLAAQPMGELLPSLIAGVRLNLQAYWHIIPRQVGPAGPGHLLALVALGLIGLGAVRGGRRLLPLSLSVAASLLLILAWPFSQARFVIGLVPVAAPLMVVGWCALAERLPPRGGLLLATALLLAAAARQPVIRAAAHAPDALAAVGFQPVGRTIVANGLWLEEVAPWVLANTPRDARILTEGAAGLWLVTGRVGVAALPATPNFAGGVADPLRAVASRLVSDSISIVIASSPPVYAGVAGVEQSCPGTFQRGRTVGHAATAFSVHDSTRACLGGLYP